MSKGGFVYMLSSPNRTTLYTGVTSDLIKRTLEHRIKQNAGSFSAKYNCVVLVYYQFFERIEDAIAEEKRIKGGSRTRKERLIEGINPDWRDLWEDVLKEVW